VCDQYIRRGQNHVANGRGFQHVACTRRPTDEPAEADDPLTEAVSAVSSFAAYLSVPYSVPPRRRAKK
jgi:hypothetical protein